MGCVITLWDVFDSISRRDSLESEVTLWFTVSLFTNQRLNRTNDNQVALAFDSGKSITSVWLMETYLDLPSRVGLIVGHEVYGVGGHVVLPRDGAFHRSGAEEGGSGSLFLLWNPNSIHLL